MEEIDRVPQSPFTTARRNGLLGGLLLIGYFMISSVTGIYTEKTVWTNLLNVVVSTGIFLAISHKSITTYRDGELDGVIDFGTSFKVAFLTVLVAVLISVVFEYIFIKFIDRSILADMREAAYLALEKEDLPDDQYETAVKMLSFAVGPGMLAVSSFFISLVWGAAVAALTSAIVPKNNTNLSVPE